MLFGPQVLEPVAGQDPRNRTLSHGDDSYSTASPPSTVDSSEVEREPLPLPPNCQQDSVIEGVQKVKPRPNLQVKIRSSDRSGSRRSRARRAESGSSETFLTAELLALGGLPESSNKKCAYTATTEKACDSLPLPSTSDYDLQLSSSITVPSSMGSRQSYSRQRPSRRAASATSRASRQWAYDEESHQESKTLGLSSAVCMYPTVWSLLGLKKRDLFLTAQETLGPICVTGVDRFAAAWIVAELLDRGYRVRGTVENRGDQISGLLNLPHADTHLELVEANLLTPESCDIAVGGCQYVIHTGLPSSCSIRDPLSELTEPGVHGIGSRLHVIIPMMTNFVQACARAKIRKMVLLSSIAALADSVGPDSIITEDCWNRESTIDRNPHFLAFKLAEEISWRLTEQLPVDNRFTFITVNAGTLMGPDLNYSGKLAPGNQVIYELLTGKYSALVDLNWAMVDVRDNAKAVVSALENLEVTGRFIAVNRSIFLKDIVDILAANGFGSRDLPWRVGLPNWVARLPAYSLQLGQVGAALFSPSTISPKFKGPFRNDRICEKLGIRFSDERTTIVDVAHHFMAIGLLRPWTEDVSVITCAISGKPFNIFRWKHHCRECGRVVCDEVSRSRVYIEGVDDRQRMCDDCVRSSIPELLRLLLSRDLVEQRRAVLAFKSLTETSKNHLLIARQSGFPLLLHALHSDDSFVSEHAAYALLNLSLDVTSCIQLVLEGAVLEMMESTDGTVTQRVALQALRRIWSQINSVHFRRMLLAAARVSPQTSSGNMKGCILITFVHLLDPLEVVSLLPEGLISVMLDMLSQQDALSRRASANAIKHLIPRRHYFDVKIWIPPYVVDNHEELLSNSSLADIQFLVQGCITPINAHKVVLFVRNSYFKNMFGTSTAQVTTIQINDCSYEVFRMLLRFLYTGNVTITLDTARELLVAAEKYQVKELLVRTEKYLAGELTVEDVTDLLYLSIKCHADNLKRVCIAYLLQNIHEVVRQPSWENHMSWAAKEILGTLSKMLGRDWEEAMLEATRNSGDKYRIQSPTTKLSSATNTSFFT